MKYSLTLVLSPNCNDILLIKKEKGPYPGLYNAFGGKIESGESIIQGSKRELIEETGILDGRFFDTGLSIHFDYEKVEVHLSYCLTKASNITIYNSPEGKSTWFTVDYVLNNIPHMLAGDGNLVYFIKYVIKKEKDKI